MFNNRFLALVAILCCLWAAPAKAVFAIGNLADNSTIHSASSGTLTISVSAGSIILVETQIANTTTTLSITSVTSPNLTWVVKGAIARVDTSVDTAHADHEVWWAYSSGALTNQVITVNFSGVAVDAHIHATELQGVLNPSSPWDTNVSLPATNGGTSGVAANITLSTTSSTPIVLWSRGSSASASPFPAGFTSVYQLGGGGLTVTVSLGLAYQIFTSAQSSANYPSTSSAANDWTIIGNALAQSVGGSSNLPLLGAGH